MKILLCLSLLIASALGATVVDPTTCGAYPCLVFEDNFDFLDHDVWEHEITESGGGNWEFEVYVNNRSVSYTKNSILYIKPQLVADWKGEAFLSSGTLDIWGGAGRNDVCTGNWFYGCSRTGTPSNIINPIMSARLRTLTDFAVRFGRIEIVAKMPRGQWLWPAIWMLPQYFRYGPWPASGEIDIVESRGNDDYGTLGNQYAASTLHWGPYFELNKYGQTTAAYQTATLESFADGFHTWTIEWSDTSMLFYLDGTLTLTVDPGTSFWDFGQFVTAGDIDNPWAAGGKMAPFDQKFFFILNLAVGGTNGFFPDDVTSNPAKPWSNTSPTAYADFWNGRDLWLPSWQQGESKISENAALQIDSIRVYKTSPDP